jgi:hypothetical protein
MGKTLAGNARDREFEALKEVRVLLMGAHIVQVAEVP